MREEMRSWASCTVRLEDNATLLALAASVLLLVVLLWVIVGGGENDGIQQWEMNMKGVDKRGKTGSA